MNYAAETKVGIDRQHQLLQLVGDLYDAATDLNKWPDFLRAAALFFNARGAQIMIHDNSDNRRVQMSIVVGYEDTINEETTKKYQEHLPTDPRLTEWMRLPGKPQHERQFMDEATLHASSMYREVLKPAEMEYHLAVTLEPEPDAQCAFAIIRDPTEEQFTDQDCDLMGELVPHLRRAINIQNRIAKLDFNNRMSLNSLDSIPMGIFFVNEANVVLSCNKVGSAISRQNDGFELLNRTFLIENQSVNNTVKNYIHHGIMQARAGNVLPNQAFSIPRTSGATPLSLIISILWGNHICIQEGLINEPVAVLYLTDPDQPIETEPELLCRLFGLTPAEARIVKQLVSGMNLKQSAKENLTAESTARQHLKNIFIKMGCTSQKDMVARVLTSPIWAARKT